MSPKRCPWWKGHDWRADGSVYDLILRETCAHCGWHRFHSQSGGWHVYPPIDPA